MAAGRAQQCRLSPGGGRRKLSLALLFPIARGGSRARASLSLCHTICVATPLGFDFVIGPLLCRAGGRLCCPRCVCQLPLPAAAKPIERHAAQVRQRRSIVFTLRAAPVWPSRRPASPPAALPLVSPGAFHISLTRPAGRPALWRRPQQVVNAQLGGLETIRRPHLELNSNNGALEKANLAALRPAPAEGEQASRRAGRRPPAV